MKRFFLIALLCLLTSEAHARDGLKFLPVQDAGRVKPFDTFAREALQLLYGKQSYKDHHAADVVMTWLLAPDLWDDIEFVQVRHSGVREALGLPNEKIYYSPKALFNNHRVALILSDLRALREKKAKLNPYFQAVQLLESQLATFQAVKTGEAIRLVPQKDSDAWLSIAQLKGELLEKFLSVRSAFAKDASVRLTDAKNIDSVELNRALNDFEAAAKAQAPDRYANPTAITVEVMLNTYEPFQWAWIFYLIGGIFLAFTSFSGKRRVYYPVAWASLLLGVAVHIAGLAARSYLTGRPPVSNMYETVVWVPLGTMIFAMVMERIYKTRLLLFAAILVAVLCLILSNLAPSVLDASIHPLEPVLRSTFWLSTHVLIITLSYAAFFLAFALGDLLLFYYLKDERRFSSRIEQGVQMIYRSIQVGVVLLALGIILGGIWADYSWGRFWGWDPKETWALIALLGYIGLLHARLVGWVRNFGMAAGAVVSFSLVIMAWYGVNFVLGAGLHSYGFGAGGVEYVSLFVGAHLLFVIYSATVRFTQAREKNP